MGNSTGLAESRWSANRQWGADQQSVHFSKLRGEGGYFNRHYVEMIAS